MRRVTLRRNSQLAAVAAILISGTSVTATAQESSANIATVGESRPPASIDIGALAVHSDFTVFMRKDVPEDVRRAALRRLWVLMQLPASCHELCSEPEPTVSGLARLASERLPVAAQ